MIEKFSKDEIFNKIREILKQEFDVDNSIITKEADLFIDLDLDSIDAVDLAVRLQQYTNKRIPPEKFKGIRTLNDVVEAIYALVSE